MAASPFLQVKALSIPASENFDFALFLADPKNVRDWNIQVRVLSPPTQDKRYKPMRGFSPPT